MRDKYLQILTKYVILILNTSSRKDPLLGTFQWGVSQLLIIFNSRLDSNLVSYWCNWKCYVLLRHQMMVKALYITNQPFKGIEGPDPFKMIMITIISVSLLQGPFELSHVRSLVGSGWSDPFRYVSCYSATTLPKFWFL